MRLLVNKLLKNFLLPKQISGLRHAKSRPEDPHQYYKWDYKPLPVQTNLDKSVPEFSVRPPEFTLPKMKKLKTRVDSSKKAELERLSRTRKLFVHLEHVQKEWMSVCGLLETEKLAKYYGLYRDLFNNEEVKLKTLLNVLFGDAPVHRGNFISLNQLNQAPTDVSFECDDDDDDSKYSLILSNLDGNPFGNGKEVLHWMICDMSNDLSSGRVLYDYIPPLPWKGTGFHRVVFTLYQQRASVELTPTLPTNTLKGRTFSSREFAESHRMHAIGLCWFQAEWSESIQANCLTDLGDEPRFDWEEYVEPKIQHMNLKRMMYEMKFKNM